MARYIIVRTFDEVGRLECNADGSGADHTPDFCRCQAEEIVRKLNAEQPAWANRYEVCPDTSVYPYADSYTPA
jgi:hypothetical protein